MPSIVPHPRAWRDIRSPPDRGPPDLRRIQFDEDLALLLGLPVLNKDRRHDPGFEGLDRLGVAAGNDLAWATATISIQPRPDQVIATLNAIR